MEKWISQKHLINTGYGYHKCGPFLNRILMKTLQETIAELNFEKYGFSDVMEKFMLEQHKGIHYRKGGGFFWGNNPNEEYDFIHIVPHGGAKVPRWCLDLFKHLTEKQLAHLIVDNNDTCTTEIAKELIRSLPNRKENIGIAYFDVSRILIDANRGRKKDQVNGKLYKGNHGVLPKTMNTVSDRLRNDFLNAWLKEINRLIIKNPNALIFHHHSFDIRGAQSLLHDRKPFELRPVSQFFYKKPINRPLGGPQEYHGGFMGMDELYEIRKIAAHYLEDLQGEQVKVQIDTPLIAPIMPYEGTTWNIEETGPTYSHFIYELRKDVLKNRADIKKWCSCIFEIQELHKRSAHMERI